MASAPRTAVARTTQGRRSARHPGEQAQEDAVERVSDGWATPPTARIVTNSALSPPARCVDEVAKYAASACRREEAVRRCGRSRAMQHTRTTARGLATAFRPSSERLPEVHAAVHHLEPQRFVGALRGTPWSIQVLSRPARGDPARAPSLPPPASAPHIARATLLRLHVPALDEADRAAGVAAVRVGAKPDLDETDDHAIGFGDEEQQRAACWSGVPARTRAASAAMLVQGSVGPQRQEERPTTSASGGAPPWSVHGDESSLRCFSIWTNRKRPGTRPDPESTSPGLPWRRIDMRLAHDRRLPAPRARSTGSIKGVNK